MKSNVKTRSKLLSHMVSLAVAGSAMGLSAAAVAQGPKLEEVTVTAQKLTGDIQDIPIAITSFTSNDLEQLSSSQVKDIARLTPGLTSTPGPNGGNEGLFYIRGIGQNDGNAATDPGVGTYLDGVYIGRATGASLDTLDLQQIEVLRGPQGTLFGRNTIGGAINVMSKKPDVEATSGQVKASWMERDGYKLQFAGNLPLGDTLALRVTGVDKKQDGWGRSVYTDDTYGDIDTTAGRAKLLWNATDALEVMLSVDATKARGTSQPTILTASDTSGASPLAVPFPPALANERSDDIYKVFSSIDPKNDLDVWGTSLHVNWDTDLMRIESITAYRDMESFTTQDFDGGGFAFYDNFMDQAQDQFSQELLFSGVAMDNKLDWLVGLYYFEEEVDYTNSINLGTNTNLFPFSWEKLDGRGLRNNQRFNLEVETMAAFFHFKYRLTDSLALTVGGRYNDEEKTQSFDFFIDNTDSVFSFIPAPFPGNPAWPNPGYVQLFTPGVITPTLSPDNPFLPANVPTTYNESWGKFTPKVVLDWEAGENMMVYLSYAEGFKSGGWNGRPQDTFAEVPTYEPEEVSTYEIGIKSEWMDQRLRFNGAYFYSDYEDIQLLVLNPGSGFFETDNAAKAELQGIELDVNYLLTENLQVMWTGTWTDTEYSELDLSALISGIDEDDMFPLTPEYTTSLSMQYTADLGDNGSVILRGDYTWQDDIAYGAANGQYEVEGDYGLLNMRLTWESPSKTWAVAGYVLNATNEEYFSNGQDVVNGLGVAFSGVGAPQEFGLDVMYSF
tara:strand:- start:126966 stop:129314 length:2349 start_codon:yes stop_codon:yes gene_type:complete